MQYSPFTDGDPVASIAARNVVAWTQRTEGGRLLLPPIQRSLVWRNSQILNYWDSLLRGYPAGLMMVHRSRSSGAATSQARTADGQTCATTTDDYQLFDGQQRLSALLLGHSHGQLAAKLRLWVDLARDPDAGSGLLFQLRISSTGQPFGYQATTPNQKFSLGQRRLKIDDWKRLLDRTSFDPREAFGRVEGKDLIGDGSPIPLAEAVELVNSVGPDRARTALHQRHPNVSQDRLATFLSALDQALKRSIIFQLIDESVLAEESEYIRFFGRLGQGGTALSQDELTYSIIKHHYPEVHDRMSEIMEGSAGRLASEVHLVLGAIRVAKIRSGWRPNNIWEVIGRPTPAFVSRLQELPDVRAAFRELIPEFKGGRLVTLLQEIRERLVYQAEHNSGGLPVMLLARMSAPLVDVLLLLADLPTGNDSNDPLPAFVLYWLIFVSDSDKAANHVYRQFLEAQPTDLASAVREWITRFEQDGAAHAIPLLSQMEGLHEEVRNGDHRLKSWSARFISLDADAERPTGNCLRVLSTSGELIKRALLWLQRIQLSELYPHFDPTSAEDEDLPIDLDHRMPRSVFAADWREFSRRLDFVEESDGNIRNARKLIGNSLGNLRWLDASENRSRGAGDLEPDDFIQDVSLWNQLRGKNLWDRDDVALFQRLIDEQTVNLCRMLLEDSGISRLRNGHSDAGPPTLTLSPASHSG
ncbi:MAG: DUF262 domain-containing protein [Verrucomicrobiota bacterium]